ncbi:MAG: DinB family protein [Dehalococcoidia bacterium]|nr:DinB family protein [Dehalococcoidia bacterium]
MELKDFIQSGLDRVKQATMKAVDGLNPDELKFRPGAETNSIGLIFFHQARSEDMFVQSRIQGKPEVWESENWYRKLNMTVSDSGGHLTVEQIAAFRVPELKDLVAYAGAVRTRTIEYLKSMTAAQFDRVINMPRRGDVSIAAVFSIIMVHSAEHAGDISYLRGLQRGLDK